MAVPRQRCVRLEVVPIRIPGSLRSATPRRYCRTCYDELDYEVVSHRVTQEDEAWGQATNNHLRFLRRRPAVKIHRRSPAGY